MRSFVLLATVAVAFVAVSSLAGYSHAQSIPVGESPFERSYGDVKFLDAYFGTEDQKIEVEPGDSNVPLTVVLANVGTHDITGIQSQLLLPLGFSGSGSGSGSGSAIRADSSSNPLAGEIFYLTFSVNLDKSLQIRQYPASIEVDYSRLRESGTRVMYAEFDFRVTGGSVINAHADQPFLTPLRTNDVSIQITNDGTAQISGVDISTDSPTFQNNLENVVIPVSNWNVGQIEPGSSESIDFTVYVPESLKGNTLKIPLSITYYNSYGDPQQISRAVDFFVKGFVDQSGDNVINVRAEQPFLTSLKTNHASIQITNDGADPISGVDITTDIPAQSGAMATVNNLENVVIPESNWNVGQIEPGSSESIDFTVYVPESIKDQTLKIPLSISYYNSYGDPQQISRVVDFYVKGFVDLNVFNVNVVDLSAGQLVVGEIINEGNEDGLFGFVSVEPRGDSNLKQVEQFIDEIETDSPVPFNAPIEFDGQPQYGEHEITIHVRYKDSVRDETVVSHDAVIFIQEPVVEEEDATPDMALVIIPVAVAIGVGVYLAKSRKKKISP